MGRETEEGDAQSVDGFECEEGGGAFAHGEDPGPKTYYYPSKAFATYDAPEGLRI